MGTGIIKIDGRSLGHAELSELRRRGVAAVQNGESPIAVSRILGVTKAAVFNWLALYRGGGWQNLDAKKRGGRKPILGPAQLEWVYKTVSCGDPRQLKFEFALWSAKLLMLAIRRELGVSLSKASVCRLLHQLGLTPQKPLWRAYQRDPATVEKWLQKDYPAIKRAAKRAGATIWFGDEAGVRSESRNGTTWAPKGCTPVVSTTGARFGLNLISAVSAKGEMRFICVDKRVNSEVFILFLKRLLACCERPVFLIVDGHSAHKSAKTAEFVAQHKKMLRLYFLPPYSPDLNPDELVWNHLKNHGVGKRAITGPDQLGKLVMAHMRHIQKRKELVKSFFMAPSVEYTA